MMVDKEGKKLEFHEVVSLLLQEEHDFSKRDADALVTKHTNIIVQGIISNNYRAAAMAILMKCD